MTAGSTMQTACGEMTSRIPDEFLSATISPGERRLIHMADIAAQVNDRQWLLIEECRKQATITNGRVTTLEKKTAEAEKTLSSVRAARRAALWLCTAAGGVTMLVLDKLIGRWLGVWLAICVLSGCARHTPAPAAYTKPSVVPVAVPVATAREAIGETRGAIGEARKAVGSARASAVAGTAASVKAVELSKDLAEKTAGAKTEEAKALAAEAADLQGQVAEFRNDITRITLELDEAEAKAKLADEKAAVAEQSAQEAQEQIAKLDTQIGAQTSTLNQTAQDLNSEQAARKTAEAGQKRAESALAALRVKVGIWIVVILLLVGASVYFKFVRFGV